MLQACSRVYSTVTARNRRGQCHAFHMRRKARFTCVGYPILPYIVNICSTVLRTMPDLATQWERVRPYNFGTSDECIVHLPAINTHI